MSPAEKRVPHSSHPIIYRLLRLTLAVLMRIVYRYRIRGLQNVPSSGTTLFAVNHLHLFDPAAVGAGIKRQVVLMAADKWADHWFIRLFLKGAGVIFVRRGEVDRVALRASLEVLEAGGALAVAPEGTRSRSGVLQRAKPGIAYLATRTNATIVPVACWGVENLGQWRRLKRPECTVVVGDPFTLPKVEGRASTAQLQAYADEVMVRVAALLPESYRGVYASLDASAVAKGAVLAPAQAQV